MNSESSKKHNLIEIFLIVISSWAVYGSCQEDFVLPLVSGSILSITFFRELLNPNKYVSKKPKKISWATVLTLSLFLGWMWITISPRNYPSDFIQSYTIFVLQSGSIFASILIWFNQNYTYRFFFLRLMAWITVALSVNVDFNPLSLITFSLFAVINIGLIIIKPLNNFRTKLDVSYKVTRRLPYMALFIIVAIFLSVSFVIIFRVGDMLYMKFMRDYAFGHKKHHFFAFDPALTIQGPGYSGNDIHPVLEIDNHARGPLYLTAQIFDRYENGVWYSKEDLTLTELSNDLDPDGIPTTITMFENLKNVIPAPRGITSVTGHNGPYELDQYGILHSRHQNIHKVTITGDLQELTRLNTFIIDRQQSTQLEEKFSHLLQYYLQQIIGDQRDAWSIAIIMEHYFRTEYGYSLDVNFKADDNGLLYMLDQKPDAYCSFFASAMGTLLRSAGIPSRLVVGFLGTEVYGRKKDKILVRVRDAHAWVEAYLPIEGGRNEWVRFDPTPPNARLNALNEGKPINRMADAIWLFTVRLRSEFKNLESEKLLTRTVIILFFLVFIRNYSNIKNFIAYLKSPKTHKKRKTKKKSYQSYIKIYREFEHVLKRKYKLKRSDSDTNQDFLNTLKQQYPHDNSLISKSESFLSSYQRQRFGEKPRDEQLQNLVREIKQLAKR